MRMSSKFLIAAIGAATIGAASVANAAVIVVDPTHTYTQADAIGNSFAFGDKVFSDFQFPTVTTVGNAIASPVSINFDTANNGDYVISFSFTLTALGAGQTGGAADLPIKFSVAVDKNIAPANQIEDVGLTVNGSSNGIADASVDEYVTANDFYVNGAQYLAHLHYSTFAPDSNVLHQTFDPQDKVYISKDINVTAFPGGNYSARISIVDQSFSQVPEPASLGVLGLGGAALLFRRKRA